MFISDILEGVTDHADAHIDQIRGGNLKNVLGKLLAVLVNLL